MKKRVIKLILLSIIAILLLISGFQAKARFVMTPYLQAVTQNSVYVLVECDTQTPIKVKYGQTMQYGSIASTESTESTGKNTYVHNVKLTGLYPYTLYHYKVYEDIQNGQESTDYTFTTAVGEGVGFRCTYLADFRTYTGNTNISEKIISNIAAKNPSFALIGGDTADNGAYEEWKSDFFSPTLLKFVANVPFFNSFGNHEQWNNLTAKAFNQAPSSASNHQAYYSFDCGDMHVLVLYYDYVRNTSSEYIKQKNFAINDLANTNKKWKIVSVHTPAYVYGGHNNNASMIAFTNEVLRPGGVKMILSGDSHFYQRNEVDGIQHVTIGSVTAPLYTPDAVSSSNPNIKYSKQTYCYGILDVTPKSFLVTVRDEMDNVLETFSLDNVPQITPTIAPTSIPTPTSTPTFAPTPTPTATPTPTLKPLNMALKKQVVASSSGGDFKAAYLAVDGDIATRWASSFSDPQWIYVDLGNYYYINGVLLNWAVAYGKAYEIQVSDDGVNWSQTVYSTVSGNGGIDEIRFSPVKGRYVRMYGTSRGTKYGYSLWEFEVYGDPQPVLTPTNTPIPTPTLANIALNKVTSASSFKDLSRVSANAVDGDISTRWASEFKDYQWIAVDLGGYYEVSGLRLNWSTAYATSYEIQISSDGLIWQPSIYTTTTAKGGIDNIEFSPVNTRYIRMNGLVRGTQYGFALWEFEVFGR